MSIGAGRRTCRVDSAPPVACDFPMIPIQDHCRLIFRKLQSRSIRLLPRIEDYATAVNRNRKILFWDCDTCRTLMLAGACVGRPHYSAPESNHRYGHWG